MKAEVKTTQRDIPGITGISGVSVEGDTVVLPSNATKVDLMVGKLMKSVQDFDIKKQTYSETNKTVQALKTEAEKTNGQPATDAVIFARANYLNARLNQVGREYGNKLGIIEMLYDNREKYQFTPEETNQLLNNFKAVQLDMIKTINDELFVDGDKTKGLKEEIKQIEQVYQILNSANSFSNETAKNINLSVNTIAQCEEILNQTTSWFMNQGRLPKKTTSN